MVSPGLKKYKMALEMIELVETKLIVPGKFTLRATYDDISSLMSSIRSNGLLQPIIVRPSSDSFELVAGHRRFTACRKLGWTRIPCVVKELTEKEAFELALVENVQKQSLNPVEEALAFKKYVHGHGWGGTSELARRIGKSEEYVSHRIGLLSLPESVLGEISNKRLSASCAYELKMFREPTLQKRMAELAVQNRMNVRSIRRAARLANKGSALGTFEQSGLSSKPHDGAESGMAEPELEHAVTALKMCLIRLDALLHTMKSGETRATIQKTRLNVHSLIDDLMKFEANREELSIAGGRAN